MHELPPELMSRLTSISEEADALARKGSYSEALAKFNEAWSSIPEPKNEWEASTWLLAAIGDVCFLGGFFISGSEALRYATYCPGGLGNPFIHMRLGQCELERGEMGEAAEHLCRAYALEGKDIFKAELPKYFEFLQSKIEPPASGVW